ncbi:hypothetical protein [Marinovum sp.]|uniref:hypothetical protein n=1 Tax=Marinovum sp. TaxID=2024839 RepID=UPI003A92151F
MQSGPKYIAILFLGGLSLLAGASVAQQPRPPQIEATRLAEALGVPESALASCLPQRPEPGQRPQRGDRPARPDAAEIARCLGTEGHRLTAAEVDQALAAAAPRRP